MDPATLPEEPDLPRAQAGSQPQHLLITLLADYWFGRREMLPSAALVALVAEFGVTPVGARAALSRLTRRGLLDSTKSGRRTFYGLSESATKVLESSREKIMQFGLGVTGWNGMWTVAAFTLPEERRDLRHALRTQLRWLGFAALYDGMWVSPRADPQETWALLRSIGVRDATVLRGEEVSDESGRPVLAAWDLSDLRRVYERFTEEYEPLLQRTREGSVTAAEALLARTRVMDTWRTFPGIDPDLPPELLPPDWPRSDARSIFAGVYDGLGPLAVVRVRQVLAEFAPDLAPLVHHLSTS